MDVSLLRQLIKVADDAVVVVNGWQTIVFFNQGAERIFGYRRAEVLGKHLDILLPADFGEQHREYVHAFRDWTENSRPMTRRPRVQGRRADGSLFPAEISITKVKRDGAIVLAAVVRDVTERTREETIMRAIIEGTSRSTGERFFHAMVRSLADALGMRYAAVAELVDTMPRIVRTLAVVDDGQSMPNATYQLDLGAPCDDTITSGVVVRSACSPDRAPAAGLNLRFQPCSYVGLRLEDINGMPIGLLFAIGDRESPLDERAGEMLRVFAARTSAELERQRAQAALVASESSFRSLVQGAPYGIYRVASDGSIRMANPALLRMLGCQTEEDFLNAGQLHPQLRPKSWAEIHAGGVLEPPVLPVEERVWKRRDGVYIDVKLGGRFVPEHVRATALFEMFVEDMSERRALEDSLRQAQKMEAVGQLTGGIAHDFNNLLTIVQVAAGSLLDNLPVEREDLRLEAGEIVSAARRGADVVSKLVAFARRSQLRCRPTDLAGAVRDTLSMLLRFLPANVEVVTTLVPSLALVMADAGALEHVILNLAKNAADAMPMGGRLVLSTRELTAADRLLPDSLPLPLEDYVLLEVEDSGSGMSDDVKRRLFEPFFTTKDVGLGSGLGLAMVYGIMRQHNGAVQVESTLGIGTKVRLFLPVSRASAPSVGGEVRQPTLDDVRGGSECILFVDDDQAVRGASLRLLESKGYHVLLASDGLHALEILDAQHRPVDLLISDMVMPCMGGAELVARLCARGERIRVMLSSGHVDESLPGWAEIRALPFTILQKPWGNVEFLRRIRFELDLPVRDWREVSQDGHR
jgi:PAS domain S-box-containing protein